VDGTNATGSVCIGTDGAQSAVRQLALPGEAGKAIPLDVVLYNMDVCYGDAERAKAVRKVHFMNSVALHPEKNLSIWTSSKSSVSTVHNLWLISKQFKMFLMRKNQRPGNFKSCQLGLPTVKLTKVAPMV
jgi:hypothetical protein